MAEFDELDGRLRDALGRAAEPGDPAGVADAIRARLASGDSGTSVAASTAPGWGGGVLSWMPWLALVVAGAVVGGAIGVSGLVGRPAGATVVDVPAALAESAAAYACVDGERIGRLAAGTRVLATQRSEDSLWVGVRDPGSVGSTVWVALADVTLDGGQPAIEALPIGGACPAVVVTVPTAAPVPPPEPGPAPAPNPVPNPGPVDGTSPSSGSPSVDTGVCPAIVRVSASDDVGVTGVTVSWSGAASGSAQMSPLGGGLWQYAYDSANSPEGNMTFSFVARDAAGNTSAPIAVNTYMVCLI